MSRLSRHSIAVVLCLLAVGLLAGCSTYNEKNRFAGPWLSGDLATAEKEATRLADKADGGKDEIIWRLEQATILRTAGKYQESNSAFDQAQQRIDRYSEEAKVKVAAEAGALLSNQANTPYRGRGYDGIMLNTYRALNFLAMHDLDKARVEIIRAFQRQQDAVEDNRRRIEKTEEALQKEKERKRIDQARNDKALKNTLNTNYANLNTLEAYSDYVNPFTVYLDGLIFLTGATDASDFERARKSFERAAGFAKGNPYVQADLAVLEAGARTAAQTNITYIIFENGRAPLRNQVRIDIPLFFTRLSYLGAAFPVLELQYGQLSSLTVTANGTNLSTAPLASMDSVVGQDFRDELPSIITRTIAATVAKGAVSYAMNEAANQQGGELAGLFSQIGTAIYQLAVNIADLRTWTTLPKEFQICRLPTPSDRKLELKGVGSGQHAIVTLEDGHINLVYVRSVSASGPMFVSQMKLK